MSAPSAPPGIATGLGHMPVWDPPAAMTAANRWTCSECHGTVIDYLGNVYGEATELTCDEVSKRWTQ